MKRFILVLMLALAPVSAAADDVMRDRIIRELREDGYTDIRIFRTFLGRLRFVGEDEETRREIVLNPATGVILRDYLRVLEANGETSSDDRDTSSGSGSQGSGANDDDDGDDDDDDDDDDDGDDD